MRPRGKRVHAKPCNRADGWFVAVGIALLRWPAMHRKPHLPTKTCPVCQRPFAWRKKWERVWDEVRYCSERCRRSKTPESKP